VGTRTSSWDALIPEDGSADEDFRLWEALQKECEKKPDSGKDECAQDPGISEAHRAELEQKLPGWYGGLPFEVRTHTPRLSADTAMEIFEVYSSLVKDAAPPILLDITHGFRSMPMLMYQALQFDDSRLTGDDVEIIYGEYISGETVSCVRNLSGFWKLSKIAQARRLFENKLNGKPLAAEIRPYWEDGAKCLDRLTEVVECNYSLQIPEVLKQINNARKNFDTAAAKPWVVDIHKDLAAISNRLTVKDEKYPVSKTVLEYAKLLEEKRLITQAVIALQSVVETAVAERKDPSKIGDYGWFHGYYGKGSDNFIKGEGRNSLNRLIKCTRNLAPLRDLEDLRNNIAHGGSKDKKTGDYPHQASIPGVLKKAHEAIAALFKALQNC
jgi:CRISPR-associated DxTHG motif protein